MAAAALDDPHPGGAGRAVFQVQAQGGRRGFAQGRFGAEHAPQLALFPGGQLQAPQAGEADVPRPGQHGAAAAVAQGLLAGPQGFLVVPAVHQQQPFQHRGECRWECGGAGTVG